MLKKQIVKLCPVYKNRLDEKKYKSTQINRISLQNYLVYQYKDKEFTKLSHLNSITIKV